MGEYQYTDNPFMNNYENYKSMDVNYAQYVPDQQANGMGGGRKKCSKNHNNNNNGGGGGGGGYANNDVNFDDSYNNYGKCREREREFRPICSPNFVSSNVR